MYRYICIIENLESKSFTLVKLVQKATPLPLSLLFTSIQLFLPLYLKIIPQCQ